MFFANKSKEIPAMMTPEYLRQQQEARISLELMLSSLLYLAKQGDPIRGLQGAAETESPGST